jgi:hypothetical protein
MAKMTREEKAAQAKAERRAQRVSEFKRRVEKLRARRVFSDSAAFLAQEAGDLSGLALMEMVGDFRRTKEEIDREAARLESAMRDARKRLAEGGRPNWHSHMVGSSGTDLDMATAKFETLAQCIRRMAWATNWRVPSALMDAREAKQEALVAGLGVRVEQAGADIKWRVTIDGRVALGADAGLNEDDWRDAPLAFDTEEAAWLTAMTLAGEREDW